MKQEFVTLYGWGAIERDTLFFRSPFLPFSKSAFAQIGFELLFPLAFALRFTGDPGPRRNVGLLIFGLVVLGRLPQLYSRLFRFSYANRIPLENIVSVEAEDDPQGLHTNVCLKLKSGRTRLVRFRKLEGQAERFVEALSVGSPALQPA